MILLHAAIAMSIPIIAPPACQCDAGDFWCSPSDDIHLSYNCSGNVAAKQLWSNIVNADVPTHADCADLKTVCDGNTGAYATPSANATCDASCYDFCWQTDVGDCADMDDEQIFCVGSCMNYCSKTHCDATPSSWTPCQDTCNKKHIEVPKEDINFVDYSLCMASCTPVPIYDAGAAQYKNSRQVLLPNAGTNVTQSEIVCCHNGCGDGHPQPAGDSLCSHMPDEATFAFSNDHGASGCNC